MEQLLRDTLNTAPIGGTILLALIVIMINAFKKDSLSLEYWTTLIGIGVNIVLAIWVFPIKGTAFEGTVMTGGFASLFAIIFLVAAGLTVLLSGRWPPFWGVDE